MSSMTLGSRGVDYIDWRLAFLEEAKTLRLEHFIIRESLRWCWDDLFEVAVDAGFPGCIRRSTRSGRHGEGRWCRRRGQTGLTGVSGN